MKLKSFEIDNFRSIEHLKCQLSPKVTILAGKNESGKTSILLALNRLRTEFNDDDVPHFAEKKDVSVVGTFVLDGDEVDFINEKFSSTIGISSYEIKVKTTPTKNYELSDQLYDKLKEEIIEESKGTRHSFNQIIKEMKESNEISNIPIETIDNLELSPIN